MNDTHRSAQSPEPIGIEESKDAMLQLARLIDPPARELRKSDEEKVDEPLKQVFAKIANARFVMGGTNTYPDATFRSASHSAR